MIEANQLTKRFGSFTAIRDVSFTVQPGEIVGFLGPNGAGKSTTMRILSGVFPPSSGRAVVAGHDVVAEPLAARRQVGYFPERVAIYFDLTVREYLDYVAQMKELTGAARRSAIGAALESAGVTHVAHRLIGTLSKGYRQRVGIAQALLGMPRVLILDEPTSGLDPEQVAEIRELITSFRGRSTVILSTHILPEVEATCDRVIIINKGEVLAVDTPQNLNYRLRQSSEIFLDVVGPAETVMAKLRGLEGVLEVSQPPRTGSPNHIVVRTDPERDLRAVLAATITRSGWDLRELRPVRLTLEDIFLTVISETDSRRIAGETTAEPR
ncbi:MAG TPA: ABC transporter ATP-binding protein [Terriglobales bacterium]|nr:ABC transporter ATP-binding protein [Terriglobales bacterium]